MKKLTTVVAGLSLILALTIPAAAQMAQEPVVDTGNHSTGQYGSVPEPPRELLVEQVSSGVYSDLYPESPQVFLASSAEALSGAIGAEVPDSGEGVYLVAYWGTKGTGGYSLAIETARLEGDLATVGLNLQEPGPYDATTQAITYPYAVAVVREPDLLEKNFSFVDQNGQELGWPVYRVEA